jgi:hypothetical protein
MEMDNNGLVNFSHRHWKFRRGRSLKRWEHGIGNGLLPRCGTFIQPRVGSDGEISGQQKIPTHPNDHSLPFSGTVMRSGDGSRNRIPTLVWVKSQKYWEKNGKSWIQN